MSTTGHELEAVNVQGLKASLKSGGNKGLFNEAICSTAGATAAKVTNTTPPSFSLVSGAKIVVKFTYAISVANATLQVGEATAKPIYYHGAALGANLVKAGTTLLLHYDGTSFNIVGDLDTDTDTVTDVAYDTSNKKITKTVGGTQSDVVTARKVVTDGGASVLLDIEQLASDYEFQPGDAVIVNGVLYRCTSATENTPLTLLVQDGKLLYVSINGQKCYMVSSNTVNAGWEKVTDLDDKYYIEQRLAAKEADINALTKTQMDALTRHTRLTNFDLATLKKAVADQNLEKYGLKVGDYKTINGHDYVIAGLNPMKGTHNNTCKVNHVGLIVIPHTTQKWNTSGNTYTGADSRGAGYMNSDLHYYLKNMLLPLVSTDLGTSSLLSHKKLLTNGVDQNGYNRFGTATGCSSSYAWEADCKICALSEAQVYGGVVWSSSGYDTGEADQQLEVFRNYKHTEIFGDEYPWLRDVVSVTDAAVSSHNGAGNRNVVSDALYVAALVLFH